METMKKEYMAPEMEVVKMTGMSNILAGSTSASTNPSGEDWEDEV